LTEDGLIKIIDQFPDLNFLELRGQQFDDNAASQLKHLQQLRSLDLSWSQNLKGVFLKSLSEIPMLQF